MTPRVTSPIRRPCHGDDGLTCQNHEIQHGNETADRHRKVGEEHNPAGFAAGELHLGADTANDFLARNVYPQTDCGRR